MGILFCIVGGGLVAYGFAQRSKNSTLRAHGIPEDVGDEPVMLFVIGGLLLVTGLASL